MENNLIIWLRRLNLSLKIILLVTIGVGLLCSNLLVSAHQLDIYFIGLVTVVSLFMIGSYRVLGPKTFKNMFSLWIVGFVIYLCFAIPRIYWGGMLSPYFILPGIYERWCYSLLFPVILLGTFTVGLTFLKITSPIEFLRWGNFGFKVALSLRALQHALQIFQDTKTALLMRNEWPEEGKGVFRFRETWLVIKYSPLLLRTSLRNIILFWFPWGWLCVVKLQKMLSKYSANR